MTDIEFHEHRFYYWEPFKVVNCWGFTGKTGRLLAVDFEAGRLFLDLGESLARFKPEEVEPEAGKSRG